MTPDEILEEMKAGVTQASRPRVFVGGLLPAICDFLLELGQPANGYADLQAFFTKHSQVTKGANALTVRPDGQLKKKKSIRTSYEKVAAFYINENNRVTFPSAAPHATGQWHDYKHWVEALVTFTPAQIAALSDAAKTFMLDHLPERKFDPSSVVVEPPIFHILLERFPLDKRRGSEKTGAAFQAMVFGFIRADAPHLQVETRRVRTGSARVSGIGDIDAWEGKKLTLSAEVKQFKFKVGDVDELKKFIENVRMRGAMGLVVAISFEDDAVALLEQQGMRALSRDDLMRTVSLWDPVKQRAALNAFEWAVVQKELSIELGQRLDEFLADQGFRKLSVPADTESVDQVDPIGEGCSTADAEE